MNKSNFMKYATVIGAVISVISGWYFMRAEDAYLTALFCWCGASLATHAGYDFKIWENKDESEDD